jgi:hypothetical protein
MDEIGTAGCFKQFALELYGSEGVAASSTRLMPVTSPILRGGLQDRIPKMGIPQK